MILISKTATQNNFSIILLDMQINEKYFDKHLFLQDEIDIILEFIDNR